MNKMVTKNVGATLAVARIPCIDVSHIEPSSDCSQWLVLMTDTVWQGMYLT
jgi:hypothetical protein